MGPIENFLNTNDKENVMINELKQNLTVSYNSLLLLKNSVNDFIDYAQIISNNLVLQLEYFKLENFFEEIMKIINFSCKAKNLKINIINKTNKNLCDREIKNDKNRLMQVVLNLLTNAIKFTNKGGSIKIIINSFLEKFYEISIVDNGIGINKENLNKLFTHLKNCEFNQPITINSTGACLGLLITQHLINYIGSDIEDKGLIISSKIGFGSTFSFKFSDKSDNKCATFMDDHFNNNIHENLNEFFNCSPTNHPKFNKKQFFNPFLIEVMIKINSLNFIILNWLKIIIFIIYLFN